MSVRSQTHDEIPTEAERALQAYWDAIGLDHATRVRLLADLNQTCAPGVWVGPFRIPDTRARSHTETATMPVTRFIGITCSLPSSDDPWGVAWSWSLAGGPDIHAGSSRFCAP
ncbi:MAG: hypothetical protein ABIU05_27930 [Nitrospirales bacterium]